MEGKSFSKGTMNKTINSLYRLREPEGLEEMHFYTEKDIIIKLNEEVGYHITHRLQYQLGRPKKQSLFYKEKRNPYERSPKCQPTLCLVVGVPFLGVGTLDFFSLQFSIFCIGHIFLVE